MNARRIVSTTLKELQQMSRDKKLYPLLFFAPVIQLVILGYAATLDIHNISTAVIDRDQSQMSRMYLQRFQHNGYFQFPHQVSDRNHIYRLLDQGKIKVGIEIPEDFQKKLKMGKPSPVQIIIDGTESNAATIALNYARMISETFSSKLILKYVDLPSFQAGSFLDSLQNTRGQTFLVDSPLKC